MAEPTRLTTREVLIAARALIADPDCWQQGKSSLSYGRKPDTYCAEEAIEKVAWGAGGLATPATTALKVATGGIAPYRFNDCHTHAEVLAAFDKAIAECDA